MNEREVFSVRQAAEFVGVSERTMRDWTYIPTFPIIRPRGDGGRVVILRESLLDWLRSQEQNQKERF